MAQTIKLKRSATSGAIPTTSSLALGEVAINTYDGKMYIKKDVGGTETIVQVGAGADSVSYLEAGMIEYEYTATSNQTSFSGSDDNSATLSYIAESIMVFVNGVLQDDGVDYTASNGTSVVFGTGLAAADEVRIVAFTNVTTAGTLQDPTKLDAISTVNNQAAYSLTLSSSAYTPSSQNALIVSLNGITQEPGDSFTISGSTITFSPALVTGDVIDYIIDMGRAVTIGEYSGDLAVGGELEVAGDIIGDLRGSTLFKAQAGEALSKGSVVYISGISGNTTVVSKADANDAAKMPSFGVAAEAVSANNPVDIYTFGLLSGLDTSSYSEGDELFVSNTAGTLTDTPPTGESSKLQKIAKVTRSHASAGSIFIMGAGRSNAVPNLDDGDIFIGNSSNQAVTAALDTSIVPESGNLYYTDARVDSRLASGNVGNITTTGYLRGPSTFTIDPAAHGDNTGTLVVAGNLQVDGTTTTINSTTMTVDDLNITLASGAANAAAANGAGITVDGASATLTYNSTADAWSFNKTLSIGVEDTTSGTLFLHGGASGNEGGELRLYTNAAHDTTYDHYRIDAYQDDLRIGRAGTTDLIINSSGNVGIGTAATTEKLSVVGDINLNPESTSSADRLSTRYIGKRDSGTVGWMANVGFEGSASNGFATDIVFSSKTGDLYNSATTEKMRITSAGKVGIGTDDPWNSLTVRDGTYPTLALGDSSGQMVYLQRNAVDNGSAFLYNKGTGSFLFGTNNTERMRITSGGNVGIGTSNPSVYGGLVLAQDANTSSDGFAVVDSTLAQSAKLWCDGVNAYLSSGNTGSDPLILNTGGGNVGIGTDDPDQLLHLLSTTNGTGPRIKLELVDPGLSINATNVVGGLDFVGNDAQGSGTRAKIHAVGENTDGSTGLVFYTAGAGGSGDFATERMRIDSAGNVGVGTSDPVDYLDVKPSGNDQRVIRISHPTAPADACAFLGFVDTGTGTNTGVALGVQYSSTYYNAITIDRVTRNVRIGTETAAPNPDALLHLHKNVNAGNVPFGDEASQVISTNATAAGVQGYIGSLFFGTQDVSSATQYAWRAAGIAAYLAGDLGTGGATADLLFYTANASQTPTEKMRITSGGNVGIGTTSPTFTSGNGLEIQRSDSATIRVERTGTTASAGEFFAGNGKVVLAATSNSPLQLRTNGTERMRISAGGNVGIGITTDPSAVISSSKILQLASTGNATLSVTSTDGVNDRSAILELLSSGNGLSKSIILYGDTDTSPSSPSPLVFQKYHSGARAEVARFTSTGNLRLGDSTSAFIDIKSGIGTNNGGIRWRFNSDSSVYGSLSLPYDTRATTGLHLYSGYPITYTVPGNKAHQFVTGGAEAARIDADGIKFNGDTAAANGLDDYEEGTWTPTTPNGSWTVQDNTYVKIGKIVHCKARVTATSTISSADFGGLPFTVTGNYSAGSVGYHSSISSQVFTVLVQANNLFNFRTGATQYGLANTKTAIFAFTYETS